MKKNILIASLIAFVIAIAGLSGFGAKTASAKYYEISNPPCATVTYSAWGNCISGIKTRTVIDKYPLNCALTQSEKDGRSEVCGKVLGVKIYKPGSLLRSPDGKIYVVMAGQKLKLIPNLEALRAYGARPIDNVSDALIAQYKQTYGVVLGVKTYANGTLLRGPDYKIYVIKNGKKHYIHDADELSDYQGKAILNVSAQTLTNYETI